MDNLSKLNEIIKKYQEGGEITEVIELPEVVVRAQSLQSKYGEEFDAENNFYNFVYGKPQTNTSTFKSRQDEYNKRRDRHISNALVDKVITDSRGGTLDNVYNTYGKETYDYIINNTSNSQIAGNVYDEFVSGFKHLSNNMLNDDYTSLEEKKYNASNPITSQLGSLGKMLSPLSVPYNATVGGAYTNIQGEENYSTWDGLSGNIPKNRNSQLEIFSGKPNEKILDVVDVLNINNFKKNKFYPTSQGSSFTGELPDKYKVESVLKNYKEKGGLINEEEMSNYKEQLNSILGKFQTGGKVSKTSIDFLRNFLYKNSKDSDQGLIWRFQREYGNSKPVTENDIISFQGSWQLDPKNRPKPRSRDYTPMPQVKKSSVSTYNKGKGGYSEEDLNFLTDTLYKGKGYSQEQALMQFDSEYGGGKTTPTSLNSSISNYNKGNLPKTKSKPTVANIVQNVKSTPQQTLMQFDSEYGGGKTTPTSLNSSISNYNKGNLPKTKSKPTVANIVQNVKSTPQQTTVASEPNITNSNRSNVYYNPPTPYEFSVVNPLAVSEYKLQHYNDKTKSYNGVNVNERLKYYKDNLPTVFNQFFEEKDGNFKLKDGKSYLDFQKGYNEFTDETEQLFANEYGFDKEQLAEYKNRINFTDSSKDTSRGKDNKFGEYTSTRSGFQRNVVTPEQLEQLKKEGIFTGRGVLSNPEKAKAILGEDTYNKAILGLDKYKNADYIIGTVNPETPKEKEVVAEEAKQEMTPYENKESNYTNRLPILTPDQSNIAPKYFGTRLRGIQAPWNVANFVSPEASIREINRQTNTARELITSTNPYTSASAIANLQAQENQNINNAVMQTELANQQAQNQTDNINEQRIMQTDLANNQESFAYENRSNIGLDNYYKEWTNFFDRRNKERMVNYNLQNQVNAVNAINPNYNVGFDGSIYQTPEEFSVVANKDGEMFVVDKNGKVVRKTTETTVGNTKTTTTEGDAKAMNGKTKAQEGGLLTSKNFRDFLKRNKKD